MNFTQFNGTLYTPPTTTIKEADLFKELIGQASDKIFLVSLYLVIALFIRIFLSDIIAKWIDKDVQYEKIKINYYKIYTIAIDGVIWGLSLYIFNIVLQIR